MNFLGCTKISTKPLLDKHHYETETSTNDDLNQCPEKQEQTEYDDDDDDALSLCDLPIYSSSSSVSSSKNNGSSYQEEANSFFEFFSFCGDLSSSSKSSFQDADDEANKDAIIFCGKLIVSKDEASQNQPLEQYKSDGVNDKTSKPKKRALFSWRRIKIASFRKSISQGKHTTSASVSSKALPPSSSFSSASSKKEKKKMSPAKKVSLLTSPTKSRWYMFLFGHTRLPQTMTMNLSDMKNRQRKQCSPSLTASLRSSECGVQVGKVAGRTWSGRGKGLWTLLTESATSVGKTNANDVVRAVGCVSLL